MGPDRARGRPPGRPRAPAGPRGRRVQGDRRGPRRPLADRRLAGLPRSRLRGRDRRRLDHDRRPPGRPVRRLGPRLERRDEPADPVRRGPHEPGLVRDDASGGCRRDDPGGPRRAGQAGRRAGRPGRRAVARDPRARDRRQPDHASPAPRHRSDPARLGAVRPGHRSIGPDDGGRARDQGPSRRAGLRPALHRRARRSRHGRGDPGRDAAPAPTGRPWSSTSGRTRRSCSATATACWRHRARRAGLRGCPDQRRPARRPGRDRARADRPGNARAAVQDHRLGAVVGRARLRRREPPSSG